MLAHQVGATPEGVEKPRCLRDPAILAQAATLPPADRPSTPTGADVKVRAPALRWASSLPPGSLPEGQAFRAWAAMDCLSVHDVLSVPCFLGA